MPDPTWWRYREDGSGELVDNEQEEEIRKRIRAARWHLHEIVFRDQFGNYAHMSPEFVKVLGAGDHEDRGPTHYDVAYDTEVIAALEAVLFAATYKIQTEADDRDLLGYGWHQLDQARHGGSERAH